MRQGNEGTRSQGDKGKGDKVTRSYKEYGDNDQGVIWTRRHVDKELRGQGDKGKRGQGDKGTIRQGDKGGDKEKKRQKVPKICISITVLCMYLCVQIEATYLNPGYIYIHYTAQGD